jgi:hypothetical protein
VAKTQRDQAAATLAQTTASTDRTRQEIAAGQRSENPEITKILEQTGGNITNPNDVARARVILQQNVAREKYPELAKVMQTFGGDILNPEDIKKAEKVLIDREAASKNQSAATLDQTRAQTARTRQEIEAAKRDPAAGTRSGSGAGAGTAVPAVRDGVPVSTANRYAGMTPKEAADARRKDQEEADKFIRDKVSPFVNTADKDITDLKRALDLNSQISTGITYGLPLVGGTFKALSGDRAKINEFDALAALSAKQNRIPGDSNVSNLDVKMMQLGTFSSDKEPITNKTIIEYQLAQRERDRDYSSYVTSYVAVNGRIDANMDTQWRKYLNANPITSRDRTGRVILNKDRMSYQQYFSMPRVQVDASGRER